MATIPSYTDRFGYQWRVSAARAPDGGWIFTFVSRGIRLIATGAVATPPASLGEAELKELFCDAERPFESDGETWHVGYRHRTAGRGGSSQGGLCVRFRAQGGEVRYSRAMLDFRHMPTDLLREELLATGPSGRPAARASRSGAASRANGA